MKLPGKIWIRESRHAQLEGMKGVDCVPWLLANEHSSGAVPYIPEAEAASLRAENERLKEKDRMSEECLCDQKSWIEALRAQLAEATKALEWELAYLQGCTFQGARHPYQTQIDKLTGVLAKLKAGRKEG